jgi:hypothetical protein
MEDREVNRVCPVFNVVKPVIVVISSLLDTSLTFVIYERRVFRKRRGIVPVWSHIGKDQPAQLSNGIGEVPDLLMEDAPFWLGRLF